MKTEIRLFIQNGALTLGAYLFILFTYLNEHGLFPDNTDGHAPYAIDAKYGGVITFTILAACVLLCLLMGSYCTFSQNRLKTLMSIIYVPTIAYIVVYLCSFGSFLWSVVYYIAILIPTFLIILGIYIKYINKLLVCISILVSICAIIAGIGIHQGYTKYNLPNYTKLESVITFSTDFDFEDRYYHKDVFKYNYKNNNNNTERITFIKNKNDKVYFERAFKVSLPEINFTQNHYIASRNNLIINNGVSTIGQSLGDKEVIVYKADNIK